MQMMARSKCINYEHYKEGILYCLIMESEEFIFLNMKDFREGVLKTRRMKTEMKDEIWSEAFY